MRGGKVTGRMISDMARESLRASRMRNAFVAVTIALASALLTAILLFALGQKELEREALSHRQQVSYYELVPEQLELLEGDGRIAYQIQVKSGILSETEGFGVVPRYVSGLSDEIQAGELESGRLPEAPDEIAVQGAMLEKMGLPPSVGSSLSLTFYDGSEETFTVTGILKGGEETKQFNVFLSRSYAENGSQLKDIPYEVHAKLRDANGMSAGECRELMYAIGRDAGVERKYVMPSRAFLDSLSFNSQSVMIYGMVGAVILLACILVIYGVFYLSVVGRIHQFGQLRTIGMTRRQIKSFVSREGRALFLRAAPVGAAAGGMAGYLILPAGFRIAQGAAAIALVLLCVYLITMFSVRKPARLAASVSPMEALRYVPQDTMKKAGNRKLCRRLTPVGLGLMNFSRNRKKSAVTMASLALGGILFMTAATYLSSFDKEAFPRQGYFTEAEFHILYTAAAKELNGHGMGGLQAEAPMDSEMVREILGMEGVTRVEEIKNFGVSYDYPLKDNYGDSDTVYPLDGEELEGIGAYLEEGSADREKLMSGDYILVAGNDVAEEIFGWRFTVGESVTLHYFDGSDMAEKDMTILGILDEQYARDNRGLEGWFLIPEQAILELLSYDSLNAHLLVSTEADREEAVGEELAELVAARTELDLETLADKRIEYSRNADQLFGAISGLAVFIMTFSILSMMNTLITNIVTRKQELAMLESIGMGRSQIRKMLLGESLLLVCVTLGVTMTAGTLSGYVLSGLLYERGAYYMAFRFPGIFALAYVCVLTAVPLIVTFASMRSFAGEDLVSRLRGMEN